METSGVEVGHAGDGVLDGGTALEVTWWPSRTVSMARDGSTWRVDTGWALAAALAELRLSDRGAASLHRLQSLSCRGCRLSVGVELQAARRTSGSNQCAGLTRMPASITDRRPAGVDVRFEGGLWLDGHAVDRRHRRCRLAGRARAGCGFIDQPLRNRWASRRLLAGAGSAASGGRFLLGVEPCFDGGAPPPQLSTDVDRLGELPRGGGGCRRCRGTRPGSRRPGERSSAGAGASGIRTGWAARPSPRRWRPGGRS